MYIQRRLQHCHNKSELQLTDNDDWRECHKSFDGHNDYRNTYRHGDGYLAIAIQIVNVTANS